MCFEWETPAVSKVMLQCLLLLSCLCRTLPSTNSRARVAQQPTTLLQGRQTTSLSQSSQAFIFLSRFQPL